MPVSQDDIDRLNAAIASEERVVMLNGQSVTYRSTADLITARNDIQTQLDRASPTPRRKQTYAYFSGRGY
jgi:hypothetical protein